MPFQNPGAGAAAPDAGEVDAPARRTGCGHVMGGAERGHGGGRPARVAGSGGRLGPGEGEDRSRFSSHRRECQAARGGEIGMSRLRIAQHSGHGAGLQRLLHGPQQAGGLLQRDGHETVAGKAEALQPMAIEPPMLALMRRQAAPQQRAAFAHVIQPPQRQGQCEAHGCRLVAIGARRHVMEPCALQPLRRQVPVDLAKPHQPGCRAALLLLELRVPLLQPGDVVAQRGKQPGGLATLVMRGGAERSDGSASVSAPRSLMCRSHTHDNNMIQIVLLLFHRPATESSGAERQVGAEAQICRPSRAYKGA